MRAIAPEDAGGERHAGEKSGTVSGGWPSSSGKWTPKIFKQQKDQSWLTLLKWDREQDGLGRGEHTKEGHLFEGLWTSRGLGEALMCVSDRRVRVEANSHILHGLLAGCWWWQETCALVGRSGDVQLKMASEWMKM